MEKKLTAGQLTLIGAGHVIGAGVVSVIGPAFSATGNSLRLAFAAACLLSFIRILPVMFFTGSVSVEGGKFGMVRKALGDRYSAAIGISSLLSWAARGTAVTALAGYMSGLFPGVNGKAAALAVWCAFCGANLLGTDVMAGIQEVATPLLAGALALFSLAGIFHISPGYTDISSPDFFKGGAGGFLTAVMLLSYSCDGIASLSNYSPKAENPLRTVPRAMAEASLVTGAVYTAVAFSRGGLIYPGKAGDAALLTAAKKVFPGFLYTLFVLLGPVFALLTTMNAGIPDSVLPVAARAKAGRLPAFLAAENKRGRNYISIIIVFLIGCAPLILGLSVSRTAGVTMILGAVSSFLVLLAALKFPFVCGREWKASWLYIPLTAYLFIIFLCVVAELFIFFQAAKEVPATVFIFCREVLTAGVAYSSLFGKHRYKGGSPANLRRSAKDRGKLLF